MLGDNASINDTNWNWNIPPVAVHSTTGTGDQSSPEIGTTKRIPKPRNAFTISNNILSQENVAKLDQLATVTTQDLQLISDQCQRDIHEGEDSSDESATSSAPSTCKLQNTAHHGSMENLFKPKNHRSSTGSRRSNCFRSDGDREMVERLTEENMMLISDLEKNRRRGLTFKVAATLSLAAFRTQRRLVEEVRKVKDEKVMEAAARMILHNLLLNSWRHCKAELKSQSEENIQLNKTLDNLSLQLRVVRHIQALEKEKLNEKGAEVDRTKAEMKRLREENEAKRTSIDKIESEFNALQGKVQNLDDLNKFYTADALVLKETIKAMEQSLDTERIRFATAERSNTALKQDKKRADEQLAQFTRQCQHWQERAREFESDAWALKMDLDGKDGQIKEVRIICDNLRKDKAELSQRNRALTVQLAEMSEKVEHADDDREQTSKKIQQIQAEMDHQLKCIHELQATLEFTKMMHMTTEKELLGFKTQNCKRRRDWANALYFLVNPLDAFRRSLVPISSPKERSYQTRKST